MSMRLALKVNDNNPIGTIRGFLSNLLQNGEVDFLLVPFEHNSGSTVAQTLVKEPQQLINANPLAPVMPINSAQLISRLTYKNVQGKIAVVLRPCEIRALIELVKLQQAKLDSLIIIGMDCLGTYPLRDYNERINGGVKGETLAMQMLEGRQEENSLRFACQICDSPVPENADLILCLFGTDPNKEIVLESTDSFGEMLIQKLNLKERGDTKHREEQIARWRQKKKKKRAQALAELKEKIKDFSGLLAQVANCINCHNCRVVCPICYCRECLFDSATFRHEPEQYLKWTDRKGAVKMPTDTLLYHITRMNHMLTSCVGCGLCESGCPNDVPFLKLFPLLAKEIQPLFEYIPGRSIEEPLPLITFREEDLEAR